MLKLITVITVFLTSSLIFYFYLKIKAKQKKINQRLTKFLPLKTNDEIEEVSEPKSSKLTQLLTNSSKMFKGITFSKKTERLLGEAGSLLRPEEFLVLRIVFSVGTALLAFMFGFSKEISLICTIIGYLLPAIYMIQRKKNRMKIISYQLIETLGMMANSMRAGFSFMQAMQLAGKELPEPLGPEFERAVREVGLGIPIENVFENLQKRLPNKELEVVIRAILAQRKSGGNLAELLETMEETVRGRIRIFEELKTLTAQGKMSAWVITLIPPGLGLYLSIVTPDYFKPMLGHPLGITMLTVASVSMLIGWLFIQKIIKIEV